MINQLKPGGISSLISRTSPYLILRVLSGYFLLFPNFKRKFRLRRLFLHCLFMIHKKDARLICGLNICVRYLLNTWLKYFSNNMYLKHAALCFIYCI